MIGNGGASAPRRSMMSIDDLDEPHEGEQTPFMRLASFRLHGRGLSRSRFGLALLVVPAMLVVCGPAAPSARAADEPPPAEMRGRPGVIDDLLARLAASESDAEAARIRTRLAALWLVSGSAGVDLLMQRALALQASGDTRNALAVLEAAIRLEPKWAGARKLRGTIQLKRGDHAAARADFTRALAFEDRDFAVLDMLGLIEMKDGRTREALVLLRRAHVLDPRDEERANVIERLTVEVDGQEL